MPRLLSPARPSLFFPTLFLCMIPTLRANQEFLRTAAETNVNQRYVIESVALGGVELARVHSKLPGQLRERLTALVGARCDIAELDEISIQIRKDLHLRRVTEHLSKGSAPDRVRVNFETVRRDLAFDISLPRFLFHSRQGFSGEVDASTALRNNEFAFAVVSNGDDLTERFTGLNVRFDGAPVADNKVRFGMTFEDYHVQWNEQTRTAPDIDGLDFYRARRSVAPEVTFAVARAVSVSVGTSFEQTQSENSDIGARWSNAATLDVHFGHKIEGDMFQQQVDGGYSLRAATPALGSTYAYTRHLISFRYEMKSGRHVAADELMAGSIIGQAPFFDRFVLGTSSTLQGWDRYQIDPLGGSRVVHNEISYGYRIGEGTLEGFYDAGALWQSTRAAELRHSLGIGYRQGIFVLTAAFPVRDGRIEPVFMAGMNY